jgi:hypothetical protein
LTFLDFDAAKKKPEWRWPEREGRSITLRRGC